MSIRSKLITYFMFVSVVSATLVGFLALRNTERSLHEGIQKSSLAFARLFATRITEFMYDRYVIVGRWAEEDELQAVSTGGAAGRISEELAHFVEEYKDFAYGMCVNRGGRVVAASDPKMIGLDLSGAKWVQEGLKGKSSFQDAHYDELVQDYAAGFARPIVNKNGPPEVIGVVFGALRWQAVNAMNIDLEIHEKAQTEANHIMLIKDNGQVISCFDLAELFVENMITIGSEAAERAQMHEEGSLTEISEHGLEAFSTYTYFRSHRDMPNLGWLMVFKQDHDAMFASVAKQRNAMVLAVFVVVVAFLMVSVLFASKIAQPILKIAATADNIRHGSRDERMAIHSHDEIGHLAASFNDMTDKLCETLQSRDHEIVVRQKTEADLIHAHEAAEAANKAKSEFLANMSHEIRTPLTAILGYTELMADPGQQDYEKSDCVATVRRNSEHLLSIINDILDLSKIEAGKSELNPNRCSVTTVIAEVISLMRIRAKQSGISLAAEYVGDIPESIFTDEVRVRQILLNLVGNAVKFTKEGGIRIVTSFVPQWRGDEAGLRIDVVDTGDGIAPEDVERLCQPFTQLDSSMSRRHSGTGLGLAISRRMTELMGGSLTIQSQPGEGNTFTLTIPTGSLEGIEMLADVSEAVLDVRGPARESGPVLRLLGGVRVLLAEDGPDNQRLISTVLRKANATVEVVENGRLAVDAALAEPFDVILMDMQMPEMDGYDAATLLREKGYGGPVLALTAHALLEDRQRCLDAGCDDYLTKPIDRAGLIAAVALYAGAESRAEAGSDALPAEPGTDALVSEFADDADLAEIIGDFVAGLAQHVVSMRDALAAREFEELQRESHQLKGAGGSYGYPALTDAARVLEMTARNCDAESGTAALERLAALSRAIIRGWETYASPKETRQ